MKLADKFKNKFLYSNKYQTHSDAVIIACYFNPQKNPYRLKAFRIFYESIKHLNHQIIECVIGDSNAELTNEGVTNITTVTTDSLLWHKEGLLNKVIKDLPAKYKYVFWLDTDVIFTNKNWLVDSVDQMENAGINLVQPFEYCIHLDRDQTEPHFDVTHEYEYASHPKYRHPKLWKSFGANHVIGNSNNTNYDLHGHVGFAWGAKRTILDIVPLYDRALIGGADHIIAHAGAGQFNHSCITKSFTENLSEIESWSRRFYYLVGGKIGYAKGDLYHIWHGDLENRQYLKRIQEYSSTINTIKKKDKNGLHVTEKDDAYVKKYFNQREVKTTKSQYEIDQKRREYQMQYPDRDDSFIESLMWGYMTDSSAMGMLMGGNPLGAIIGDALNNNDEQVHTTNDDNHSHNHDHGHHHHTDTTDYTQSDNFS